MLAVIYPAGLPAPHRWAQVPRERRASSSLPGNVTHRARSRDRITDIEATWVFSAVEMATWVDWYDATLLYGMRWFAMTAPGAGGFISRVLRHRTGSVKREAMPRGNFLVSATLEQRGISAAPHRTGYLFLDEFNGAAATPVPSHAPDIAPPGFAWQRVGDVGTMELDGSGTAGPGVDDAQVRSAGALVLPLTLPVAISITATPFNSPLTEKAIFGLVNIASGLEASVRVGVVGLSTYVAEFAGTTSFRQFSTSLATHTATLVFHVGGTASAYLDGVLQETFICALPTTVDRVRVYTAGETGGRCTVNRVYIEQLE